METGFWKDVVISLLGWCNSSSECKLVNFQLMKHSGSMPTDCSAFNPFHIKSFIQRMSSISLTCDTLASISFSQSTARSKALGRRRKPIPNEPSPPSYWVLLSMYNLLSFNVSLHKTTLLILLYKYKVTFNLTSCKRNSTKWSLTIWIYWTQYKICRHYHYNSSQC